MNDTATVIPFHEQFAHYAYGVPEQVSSNNGPNFQATNLWPFQPGGTLPMPHRVHIFNLQCKSRKCGETAKTLSKAVEDDQYPWLSILAHWITTTQTMSSSPMERFMDRKARITLPAKPLLLEWKDAHTVEQLKDNKASKQSTKIKRPKS